MSSLPTDTAQTQYRWAAWLIIATSVATMIGRIVAVCADTGETPMLSANDRSRWCTVRALVEDGTYAIDRLVKERHPKTGRRFWKSIDTVRHRGPDGKEHYYSSKPTLFPTMLAGQYWVIRSLTGATLGENPFFVMRLMLILTNVLPLMLYLIVLMNLADRLAMTKSAVLYMLAVGAWGTFLTTFSVTINNHVVAAVSVLLATVLVFHIVSGARRWWFFAGAGLFSAFAAANELPALSFFAAATLAAAWKAPKQTVLAFLPPAALVAAGFFGTNYLAHGTVTPAYAHRSDGRIVATIAAAAAGDFDQKKLPQSARDALENEGIELSDQAMALVNEPGRRWGIWDRAGHKRFLVVRGADQIEIREWNNWYDYQGSYWNQRQGIDRGEASRRTYAIHATIGHHGIFSLTPVWLLSLVGVFLMVRGKRPGWMAFGWMVILLTLVCIAFYIARDVGDRNYGGVTSGFRWMFWFVPLWLLCLVPAADWLLTSRTGRAVALLLLMVSVFSATYAAANPWSHPWLFDLGSIAGWWRY